MDYCTIEQLVGGQVGDATIAGYLPDVSADEDKEKLKLLITRTSRRIDSYVTDGRLQDYFAPAAAEPAAKVVRGQELSYLDIPVHVEGSVTTVTAPASVTVPEFIDERGKLVIVDDSGLRTRFRTWCYGAPYTVTARWGFEATPGEITEACLQLCVRAHRGADDGFSGVIGRINQDGTILERGMPEPVREILDIHRKRFKSQRFSFA